MREIASPQLAQRTTLRLGGTAIAELILECPDDIAPLSRRLRALGGSPVYWGPEAIFWRRMATCLWF